MIYFPKEFYCALIYPECSKQGSARLLLPLCTKDEGKLESWSGSEPEGHLELSEYKLVILQMTTLRPE